MDARPSSRLRNDWMLGICERKRCRAAEDVFELLLEVSAGALYLVEIPVREATEVVSGTIFPFSLCRQVQRLVCTRLPTA